MINIICPIELVTEAKKYNINISAAARAGVRDEIAKRKKEGHE
jgi:post-segregation antitoxin (ccd killing protein)